MRTAGRARRGTRAATACRWRQRVVPGDAGHRGQRVLSRLSGRERGTFAKRPASLGWDLGVGVVRGLEREGGADPVPQRLVELVVVALLVGGIGDPPADVDVVAQ